MATLLRSARARPRCIHPGRSPGGARGRRHAGCLDPGQAGSAGLEAGAFLDRLYTIAHANQPVGRVRYCLMLNEMASVIDDGVAFRMDEDRYYVTSTTGAVGRVYADMAFWNPSGGCRSTC